MVMLWNVRSLTSNLKLHFILQTLVDKEIGIACITESWLSPEQGHNHTLAVIKSFGFKISFTSRSNRRGGGISVLMKNNINCSTVTHSSDYVSFEWHDVRIHGQTNYCVLCIYRKQEYSMLIFLEEFSRYLLLICLNTQ